MSIPQFSVNRKVTTIMFALILVVMGIWALWGLGLDLFPEIEFPMVAVTATYPGAGSEEVEQTLTEPLEQFVGTVNNLKKVSSISRENYALMFLEFEWGTDVDYAAQDVRDAIDQGMDFLPEEVSRPITSKFDITQMPLITISITGMEDTQALKKLIEDDVATKLKRVDGVASVLVFGRDEAEIHVYMDALKMRELNVSPDNVVQSLVAQNINLQAGIIEEGHKEFLLRTIGEFETVEEIGDIIIGATSMGNPIHLKDVAKIEEGLKEARMDIRASGEDGVVMIIYKQSASNSVTVGKRVKKALDEIWVSLPNNVKYNYGLDMPESITRVSNSTSMNALIGGLLAIFMIWLFLRNWRPTAAISIAIPLSVVATFIPLRLAGYTLNIMTLGGIALGVGMLVDNAVVVIENIYRYIEKGFQRGEAAKTGAETVSMAITASTLTTIAVFLPMVFSAGLAGQLTRGLALTVSFALICSLIVSLTIVPMIASLIFKKDGRRRKLSGFFNWMREKYRKSLTWALMHRKSMIFFLIVAIALTALGFTFVGTEFFPQSDEDMLIYNLKLPVGTRWEETDRKAVEFEDLLLSIPEVDNVMTMVGANDMGSFGPEGSNQAMFMVKLDQNKKRPSFDISDEIRKRYPDYADITLEEEQMMMTGGGQQAVDIQVFGDDLDLLNAYADTISKLVEGVKGSKDVTTSVQEGKPEIEIHINKEKANRLGLPIVMLGSQIRTLTLGTVATRFRDKQGEETDIRVRLREEHRDDMDKIGNLPITLPTGGTIPLKEVADFVESEGPVNIYHQSQSRMVHVYSNRSGTDLGSLVKGIEKAIQPVVETFPPGYDFVISGEQEQMQDAFGDLWIAMLLAVILVYAIMAALFESLTQPIVIMITLPLAIIGVIWAFVITGATLSVVSFVGMIILAGIVVNNGIVLVDHVNQLRHREKFDECKALIQGGVDRLRPILITAITTIIGMLPMAVSSGSGSELRSPMALTVIGGLVSATFLTLFYVPIFYSLASRVSFKKEKTMVHVFHGNQDAELDKE